MKKLVGILQAYYVNANNPYHKSGVGSPEGVLSANIGTLYSRTDGTPSLYVKESGTGNTGWVAK
jgi:hypothetical protein